MTPAESEALARRLVDHRARGAQLANDQRPATLTDATTGYAVQAAVDRLRIADGWRPIGYKIGCTSAVARQMLKSDGPFYGRLWDRTSRAAAPGTPAPVTFVPGILRVLEPEIALLIGRDLTLQDAPYDAAAIRAATRALLPAIEVVATVFEPWTEAGAPALIADNGVHGEWVSGTALTDWQDFDAIDGPIAIFVGDQEFATGAGRNVEGGPFAATAWLANALAAAGRPLAAGDYVSTGTVVPPPPVAAGQTITADFGALGRVAVVMV